MTVVSVSGESGQCWRLNRDDDRWNEDITEKQEKGNCNLFLSWFKPFWIDSVLRSIISRQPKWYQLNTTGIDDTVRPIFLWHSKIGATDLCFWSRWTNSMLQVPGEYSWIEGYDRDGEAEEITGIQCFEELSLYVLWQLKKWGHFFVWGRDTRYERYQKIPPGLKSKVAENTDILHSTV